MHALSRAAALAAALLSAWAPAAQAKLKVVTTTTDLADIARSVGGDGIEVSAMAKGWQDPHFVDAKPSLMLLLHGADMLFAVGLDLEIGWLPGVIQGARNPEINPGSHGYFECSEAITPIEAVSVADRRRGDVHPRGNPHYWLDPENAKLVAAAMAEKLAFKDPGNAGAYREGAKKFAAAIDARMSGWQAKLAPFKGAPIVSYHKTLNYFYLRFDLTGLDSIEPKPGIPPSPAHVAALIQRMRQAHAKLVLVESFYDRRVPEVVARQAGATMKVVAISVDGLPGVDSYFKVIDALVNTIAGVLGGGQ